MISLKFYIYIKNLTCFVFKMFNFTIGEKMLNVLTKIIKKLNIFIFKKSKLIIPKSQKFIKFMITKLLHRIISSI